jgi:hypothetical protein
MGKKKVIIMFFRVARIHDLERRKKNLAVKKFPKR